MSEVTVRTLATLVGTPVDTLLEQLAEAGMSFSGPDQVVTATEKMKLLGFLRRTHGRSEEPADAVAPRQITLKRRKVEELTVAAGKSKTTVNVEVRQKRTYVKRAEIESPADEAREEAQRKLAESQARNEAERAALEDADSKRREEAERQAAELEAAADAARKEAEEAAEAARLAAEEAAASAAPRRGGKRDEGDDEAPAPRRRRARWPAPPRVRGVPAGRLRGQGRPRLRCRGHRDRRRGGRGTSR